MAKGILYLMSTVVPGLIKIGKTGKESFESRMYHLERNGYNNVVGLKREFAIEVEDYDEKEKLLFDIFSKSKIVNSELFALDQEIVISLLSSFDGVQIYPKEKTKKEVFKEATMEMELNKEIAIVPNGEYTLTKNSRKHGKIYAKAVVKDGVFRVLKGSLCADATYKFLPKARKNANILNNILQEDVECFSPSIAAAVVMGRPMNGWLEWKDKDNKKIDEYRKNALDV